MADTSYRLQWLFPWGPLYPADVSICFSPRVMKSICCQEPCQPRSTTWLSNLLWQLFWWDGMTITACDSGIWSSTNRWCLEEQNASNHLISELLCAESIDTEQLSEDPHTKAKEWNLTLFAWNVCRNPDSIVYYARKQIVPCAAENCVPFWCLWASESFLRIYMTAVDLAAHGRQSVWFLQETIQGPISKQKIFSWVWQLKN